MKYGHKRLTRGAAFVLALLTLCGLFVSCGGQEPVPELTSAAAETTAAPDPGFEITKEYVVVRPDADNDQEILALKMVCSCVKQMYGIMLNCATDFVKRGEEVKPGKYEILIGGTNRPDSQTLTEGLSGSEGLYRIVSENVIVIAGGSPDATLAAAYAFLKDTYGYEESDTRAVLHEGTARKLVPGDAVPVSVTFPTVLLNGTDLRSYQMVSRSFSKATDAFNTSVQALCGEKLKEISPEEYTGGPALFIGMASAFPHEHVDAVFDSYTYYTEAKGDVITVDFISSGMAARVLEDFAASYLPKKGIGTLEIRVPEGLTSHFSLTGEYNLLVRESCEEQRPAPGVIYSRLLYKDKDGAPVRVYALTVEKGAARLYAGTPNDAKPQNGVVSTVMNEINAAVKNGKNVIAGVNAGFFDMGGTGFSRGLCVKDGELMQAVTERPFFAQMTDGTCAIMAASEYGANAASVYNAVAGNVILMQNGKISNVAPGTEMAVTRHPRTAVGIRPDGAVVILEVDGRQPKVSNGASYCDLVGLFREFGCTEAINLDGGGSSTFIVRNSAGSFQLQNSPSDGSMRKVQDSLLVVLP